MRQGGVVPDRTTPSARLERWLRDNFSRRAATPPNLGGEFLKMAFVPGQRGRDAASAARQSDLKSKVHRKLLQSLNSDTLRLISKERLRGEIGRAVEKLLLQENIPMTLPERDRIIEEILDEVFGLGPLEPLLKDPSITDILVNNHNRIYIERRGILQRSTIQFKDDKHLLHIIEKMVAAAGRRIDEANPMVAARLADGSR